MEHITFTDTAIAFRLAAPAYDRLTLGIETVGVDPADGAFSLVVREAATGHACALNGRRGELSDDSEYLLHRLAVDAFAELVQGTIDQTPLDYAPASDDVLQLTLDVAFDPLEDSIAQMVAEAIKDAVAPTE